MQGRRFDVRLWEKTGTTILHLQVRSIGYGMRSSRVFTAAEPPLPPSQSGCYTWLAARSPATPLFGPSIKATSSRG